MCHKIKITGRFHKAMWGKKQVVLACDYVVARQRDDVFCAKFGCSAPNGIFFSLCILKRNVSELKRNIKKVT